MVYRSLLVQIIIRISLIIGLSLFAGWIFWTTAYPDMAFLVLLLIGFLTYRLVRYLNVTNRLLGQFFLSIRNDDTALKIPKSIEGNSFDELRSGMQAVNETLKNLRLQSQRKEIVSDAIIEHAAVGILSFNGKGVVECINRKGRELLGVHHLVNIKALLKTDASLVELFEKMRAGDRRVYHLQVGQKSLYLLISCTSIKQEEEELKLFSFTDIKNEMDAHELESWQKLINVLTHEIMNSVSPLTCLSEKLESNYQQIEAGTVLTEQTLSKTRNGLQVIKEQGKGLMYFVEAYRELSRIPAPLPHTIPVDGLFYYLQELLDLHSDDRLSYQFSIQPAGLQISADETLLKQVLINLLKNAQQATAGQGGIRLEARKSVNGESIISVVDDGIGIKPEDMKNVFIPFFTTKDEGSGIGLSVARQVMRLHNGNISLESVYGQGTQVKLIFPV